jgi:hypothetical protein
MTRTGKIARLPLRVREELNRRLHNGEKGRKLIAWLNQLPETKRVLAEEFGGRDIHEVNLSDWKKGGYMEWLAGQELLKKAGELSDEAEELAALTKGQLTEHLSTLVAAEYAVLMVKWENGDQADFRQKLRVLRPLSDCIMALRRGDHEVIRMGLRAAEVNLKQRKRGANAELCERETECERLLRIMMGAKT